jgi:hypothetical protein
MNRRLILCTLVLLAAGLAGRADAPKKLGDGVTIERATPIPDVLTRPAEFDHKPIRVEGIVTAVCQEMGCWMALRPADSAEGAPTLRLKVDDGVIVFPVTAKGHRAVAQGTLEKVAGDAESKQAFDEHASHQSVPPKSATAEWQLRATGALIY